MDNKYVTKQEFLAILRDVPDQSVVPVKHLKDLAAFFYNAGMNGQCMDNSCVIRLGVQIAKYLKGHAKPDCSVPVQ